MSRFRTACSFGFVLRFLVVGAAALLLARATFSSATTDGEYRKALCAYHLMQLGKAVAIFAQDHGGYICNLRGRVDTQDKEGADNAQRLKDAYGPYIHDPEVWYCPGDPYAKTHTLQPPDNAPPEDQPDMKHDHYYMSYRHYSSISQEEAPARLDAVRMVKDDKTAQLPGGVWIATPDMIMLMLDDGCFHGPALPGAFGQVYGRNVLFRDGHVAFETEETMRRPKQ
jgi:hypothetical protein